MSSHFTMGAQDNFKNANNSMQRVKVYRMTEEGKWDDQGTGHVTVDYLERSEDLGLFVMDEEDNETLLLHRISSDDIYRKQEGTIISWRDPEFSTDLALSFQETTGCSYIWDHICSVQRNMHFSSLANETFHNVNSELRELPPVELSTLPSILKTIVDSGITDQLRVTELMLHEQDFFRKLMQMFRNCENLENVDGLHLIFKIVRGIILLNSSQIFEKILGDELIMDIIGCLEYDPEAPHVHHRNFLKEHVIFKEAIPIKDPVVLSKIHQSYRVDYLKDVILPRGIDEAIVANLNSIIHSNNAIVVSLLKDDNTFIKELFARLKSPATSKESKKTLFHFLHEFCTLSKSLQMVHQLRLFRDLVSEGIFDIIADVLQSEDNKLVLTGTNILILFLNQDPNIMRTYVARQEGVLFRVLVQNSLTDFGDDMHSQFLDLLRSLLDSSYTQKDTIVEIFYEKHLGQLIDAIASSCPPNGDGQIGSKAVSSDGRSRNPSRVKPEILLNICEFLCFCVVHHPYKIKSNFLLNNVIDKILYLTRRREKYLVVAAVRFVRLLIARHDEHLMNHFVKNNLLKPIIDAFVANGDRYNLLNSVVLELFEFLQKDNLKVLIRYLIDTFWDQLVKFESYSCIRDLKVKYEQSLESTGTSSAGSLLEQMERIDDRALQKEEEDYFNEDSYEEDSASAQTVSTSRRQPRPPPVIASGSSQPSPNRSGGLVDYDYDDEDDEDYKPPPMKKTEESNEDEGLTEFRLKRKLSSKEDPEAKRLHQSPISLKTRDGAFASLCSTLSQAVLPSKKTETALFNISQPDSDQTTTSKISQSDSDKHSTSKISQSDSDKNSTSKISQSDSEKSSAEPNIEEKRSISSSDESQNAQFENQTDIKEAP
ncbi:hypothetical protein ACJIZ3_013553 [Penstemon smallii]|uniref:Serine/threonine-protein phosphatase 4 regulatory subunit 3-like central domain-containing protein n=1 Tax=Penstemon smallii TaxID=265156 RepID=A0ABD3RGX4_9LAMI